MKYMRRMRIPGSWGAAYGLLAFAVHLNTPAIAQPSNSPEETGWSTRWEARMAVMRDNNIYHLSTGQMLKMESNDPSFRLSGRYNDMESVEDVILPMSFEFEAARKNGMFELPLSLKADVAYRPYMKNSKRSYVALGLSAEQHLSEQDRIRMQSEYIPSRFWKNYLADATDLTGSVSEGERVFSPATYRQWNTSVDYRHRFDAPLAWLSARVIAGYRARTYDEPFSGRNQSGPRGAVELQFDIVKRWSAEMGFEYESMHSPVAEEVLVLDEPDYMMDFNNDLDVADNNVRTVQRVDRSRGDGLIYLATSVKPVKKLTVRVQYEHLRRQHNSQEPLDPANKGRIDTRNSVELGIDYTLPLGLHIRGEVGRVVQRTNKPGDPESLGETLDYEVTTFVLGLMWQSR